MRVLFTTGSVAGHFFPMLPLADAAERAGHDVVALTGSGGAALQPGRRVIEAGPGIREFMTETARRTGADGRPWRERRLAVRRRGRTWAPTLAAGRPLLGPDLVVQEILDCIGSLVAALSACRGSCTH